MRFAKMHGCGNDYVLVEEKELTGCPGLEGVNELAVRISDRKKGIGSDGLIVVGRSNEADVRMIMYNADGSVGKMCGNGIRCLCKYAFEKGITIKTSFNVETDSGIKHVKLKCRGHEVLSVRVNMGSPVVAGTDMQYIYDGKMYIITNVNMGNPHAVIYVDELERAPVEALGKYLCAHKSFPEGVNTEFVKIIDPGHIAMRVWERGSGETLACGTGACAAAAAGVINGNNSNTVSVSMPGGSLDIEYSTEDDIVYMEGEAVLVYEGVI